MVLDIKEKILMGIKNLPTLPTVYAALSEAMNDQMATPQKIAEIISTDQISVFKILKVANSPFFGFRGRIDTISQAIMYLGFSEIKNIVFSLSVIKTFTNSAVLSVFRPIDFWAHSIAVGISTRKIGIAIGERNLENYFLGGILHDIGKLILIEVLKDKYLEVINYSKEKSCTINDAENKVLGMNHAQVGHMVAKKWELPSSIRNTIYRHHTLVEVSEENQKLAASVHLADIMARVLKLGNAGDPQIPAPNSKIWEILHLPPKFFTNIGETILEDYKHTINLMLVD